MKLSKTKYHRSGKPWWMRLPQGFFVDPINIHYWNTCKHNVYSNIAYMDIYYPKGEGFSLEEIKGQKSDKDNYIEVKFPSKQKYTPWKKKSKKKRKKKLKVL